MAKNIPPMPEYLKKYWNQIEKLKVRFRYSEIPGSGNSIVEKIASQYLRSAHLSGLGKYDRALTEMLEATEFADTAGIDDENLRRKTCILYTNCHGLSIGRMLNQHKGFASKYTTVRLMHAGAFKNLNPNEMRDKFSGVLKRADIFIYQHGLFGQDRIQPLLENLPERTKIISVPFVSFTSLWPHFYSASEWGKDGIKKRIYPYGDTLVRKLKNEGLTADQISTVYRDYDFSKNLNLDRFLLFESAKAYSLEQKTDIRIREFIDNNFRDVPLFRTPFHPTPLLMSQIVLQILEKLGFEKPEVSTLLEAPDPIPLDELPIHPQVSKHFKLRYVDEMQKYNVLDSGLLGFEDFIKKYANDGIVQS